MHATYGGRRKPELLFLHMSVVKKEKVPHLPFCRAGREEVTGFRSCCQIAPQLASSLPPSGHHGVGAPFHYHLSATPSIITLTKPYKVRRPGTGETDEVSDEYLTQNNFLIFLLFLHLSPFYSPLRIFISFSMRSPPPPP